MAELKGKKFETVWIDETSAAEIKKTLSETILDRKELPPFHSGGTIETGSISASKLKIDGLHAPPVLKKEDILKTTVVDGYARFDDVVSATGEAAETISNLRKRVDDLERQLAEKEKLIFSLRAKINDLESMKFPVSGSW